MAHSTKDLSESADKLSMNQGRKILVIDDCRDTQELVRVCLRGHTLDAEATLGGAIASLERQRYDLVLIDISLPDGSGFDLCLQLARDPLYQTTPKILLTAHAEISEKVHGFNCGADDYVTKPFAPAELRARVESFLRRGARGAGENVFRQAAYEFNIDFQRCTLVLGQERRDLQLTPTEFRLLLLLVRREGSVLTREELERSLWQTAGVKIERRGIDSHIAHLRKKLGPEGEAIISVYGRGYSFKAA